MLLLVHMTTNQKKLRNKGDIKNKSQFVKHFIRVVTSNENRYANKWQIKESMHTSQGTVSAYKCHLENIKE